MIAEDLVVLVRSLARGDHPEPQTSPFDADEHARESWARSSANHIVDGALSASERSGGRTHHPTKSGLCARSLEGRFGTCQIHRTKYERDANSLTSKISVSPTRSMTI
jgi:hypothetical protein